MIEYILNPARLNQRSIKTLSTLLFRSPYSNETFFCKDKEYILERHTGSVSLKLTHHLLVIKDTLNPLGKRIIILGVPVTENKTINDEYCVFRISGELHPCFVQLSKFDVESFKFVTTKGFVKVHNFYYLDEQTSNTIIQEANISALFPYLKVQPLTYLKSNSNNMIRSFFAYQLPKGKTLKYILQLDRQSKETMLTFEQRLTLTEQLALWVINPQNVLHGNLNSSSVIVSHDFTKIYLINFYLSVLADEVNRVRPLGSLACMSPEVFLDSPRHMASELYALGMLLIELWRGKSLFHGINVKELFFLKVWDHYLNFQVTDLFSDIDDPNVPGNPSYRQQSLIKSMIERLVSFSEYQRQGVDNVLHCVAEVRKGNSLNPEAAPFTGSSRDLSTTQTSAAFFTSGSPKARMPAPAGVPAVLNGDEARSSLQKR